MLAMFTKKTTVSLPDFRVHSPLVMQQVLQTLDVYYPPHLWKPLDDEQLWDIYREAILASLAGEEDQVSDALVAELMHRMAQLDMMASALDSDTPWQEKNGMERDIWDAVVNAKRPTSLWVSELGQQATCFTLLPIFRLLQTADENPLGEWVIQVGCPNDDIIRLWPKKRSLHHLPSTVLRGPNLGDLYDLAQEWFFKAIYAEMVVLEKHFDHQLTFVPRLPLDLFTGTDIYRLRFEDQKITAVLGKHFNSYFVTLTRGGKTAEFLLPIGRYEPFPDWLAYTYFVNTLIATGVPRTSFEQQPATSEVLILDFANYLSSLSAAARVKTFQHPYNSPEGAALLLDWAASGKADFVQSALCAVPYLEKPYQREILAASTSSLDIPTVLCRAWAQAKTGDQTGLTVLGFFAKDEVYFGEAHDYLISLGIDVDQFPITQDMRIVQQMVLRLVSPTEFGKRPVTCKLIGRRPVPGSANLYPQMVYLCQYEYSDGMVGYGAIVYEGEDYTTPTSHATGMRPELAFKNCLLALHQDEEEFGRQVPF